MSKQIATAIALASSHASTANTPSACSTRGGYWQGTFLWWQLHPPAQWTQVSCRVVVITVGREGERVLSVPPHVAQHVTNVPRSL